MRVAIVSPYSLSAPGGVQGQIRAIAAALADRGHEVEVVTPLDRGSSSPAVAPPVVVHGVGAALGVPVNGSKAPVAPWPGAMARTVLLLRRGRFDVVHIHEPFVPGPALAALVAGPVPIIGTFHRSGSDVGYRLLGLAAGGLCRRMSQRVAVSRSARDTALAAVGGEPGDFEILWNGVDITASPNRTRDAAGCPNIVFVGRHERRKGLSVLLEAVSRLEDEIRVTVFGEGPETSAMRSRFGYDKRIEWRGEVGDAEIVAGLGAATVFVAPALGQESFGMVVAEAMAAGAPVVASDIPGYSDALGGAGLLVPPGDSVALAAALREVAFDPIRLAEMSEAGLQRARQLSLDALVDRYLELYLRAARGSRG